MPIKQGFIVGGTVSPEDAFSFASTCGFEFIELDMEQAFDPQIVDFQYIRDEISRYELETVVHLPYRLDPGSPHDHVREGACRQLESAIDAAIELGATKGVIHAESKAFKAMWGTTKLRECLYSSVERLNEYGRNQGFEVCVENLKKNFFDSTDFSDLFASTDAVACLDTGHAYVAGQDMTEQAALIRKHGERISHVHLNDSRHANDDEHLPVGLGKLDFETLVDAMEETGWSGTCTHEIFSYGVEYADHGKTVFDRFLNRPSS